MSVKKRPSWEFKMNVIGRIVLSKDVGEFSGKEYEVISEDDTYYTADQWYNQSKKECLLIPRQFVEEFIEY